MEKIGVLIPTRGNRPVFMEQCLKSIYSQFKKPDHVLAVDYLPIGKSVDITQRYRFGCEKLFNEFGCDLVFFFEDDDYYSPDYIQRLYSEWVSGGRNSVYGVGYSIYYHLLTGKWFKINHPTRASMMATMVTRDVLNIKWPADDYPYTDIEIWKQLKGSTCMPWPPICIGIKHGIGLVGGGCHDASSGHYVNTDTETKFLEEFTGLSYPFYRDLKKNLQNDV